jgi:hypothetical protein
MSWPPLWQDISFRNRKHLAHRAEAFNRVPSLAPGFFVAADPTGVNRY